MKKSTIFILDLQEHKNYETQEACIVLQFQMDTIKQMALLVCLFWDP